MTRKDAQKAGAQRGVGEVGADAQRKEGERKSAREGRDFGDAAVPGLWERRRRARAEEATSPLGHASDCGRKAAARPVGRRGLSARGAPGAGWGSRGRRCTQDLRVDPGADDALGIGGCCRGLAGVPGSVGASAASGYYRGQRMLPGLTSAPRVSGRSPRPALTPRRQERRLREAPGDTAGYLKRGESFRHSSKSTVIFILPPPGLAGDAGGAAGAAGPGKRASGQAAVAPGIRAASASARPPLALHGAAEGAAHPGHSSREDCNGSAGPGHLFLRPS